LIVAVQREKEGNVKAEKEVTRWAEESGRKLKWLAARVPCRPESLSRWLAGRNVPAQVYRDRLAEITGIEALRDAASWQGQD
jgi:hypothetical protein